MAKKTKRQIELEVGELMKRVPDGLLRILAKQLVKVKHQEEFRVNVWNEEDDLEKLVEARFRKQLGGSESESAEA